MKLTPKQLAAQVRRCAARYERRNADGDRELAVVLKRDVRALNAVADLIASGDTRGAYRRWSRLDTVVRESISKGAWRALTGGAAIGSTRWDA